MSYTGYGDDFMRRVPEGRSEALGQTMDHLRMVPKEIYECPERPVRVFVVANEVHPRRAIQNLTGELEAAMSAGM